MSEEPKKNHHGDKQPQEGRVPPRTWLLWLAILSLLPLLFFFKDRSEGRFRPLTHLQFVELVHSNQVVEATITYDPQSPLREIVGTYQDPAARTANRFRSGCKPASRKSWKMSC